MGEDRTTPEMSRYTVAQAADMLGITTGAVRNRLSRETLRSTKEKGTVYVLLPADMSRDAERDTGRDAADTPGDTPRPDHDAQGDDLREQVRYLREQLRREQDAHEQTRRLLGGALERIPAIEPPSETRETPETTTTEPEGTSPRSDSPDPQTPVQRPWWRRVFGR